ncbi:MAG TPA: sugar ABC transporter permease [Defluviitoga tunisiensis]|uniref:ABC-type sugar transport systems, permease components n=1 Tax=Defluviitoga tunisiensis TaxID=1006576 RepID=A0A0C7NW19_DEFTU|nr:sugar ABC transporter permease [Defluviitoga tunisiensis]HOP25108.1 sugar ABC transporter permease [Defluviitoga sp.]MDD3601178.1 sugar ABC transporter permease [Defluviitoga tunisiensis]CEP77663.1 ABC-type sugar transport systems, permease components [Defluviitoga tunisiensis]HHV01701.1 sugar ABC transporter permease [Defluviitoga tunisiensis]HOB55261.1 sugar ABC transporter permease [Defluviitoga tunisiensis]
MKTPLKAIIAFIGPSIILLLIFMLIPILVSLTLSFTDFNVFAIYDWSNASFIGFENYNNLMKDPLFWKALLNTLYALVVAMPLTIILALSFAALLNRETTYFKNFFKVSFYLPSITNTVAIAIVWAWMLNPDYGLINWFLGLFGIQGPNWLGDPAWAMPSVIMLVVWKAVGYNIILFTAGLQNIPDYLYEAAELDGASKFQQFLHVTIPALRPTIFFVTVMTIIGYLQLFEEPYMLTSGGPLDSTLSIVLYLYRQGFRFFKLGYASSIAFVLFIMIFALTFIQMKVGKNIEV